METIIEVAIGIGKRYAIEKEAIGMDKDHMHILSSSHSKMSPGEIVRILKGITGREVFSRKPLVKKKL